MAITAVDSAEVGIVSGRLPAALLDEDDSSSAKSRRFLRMWTGEHVDLVEARARPPNSMR
jgi:hypothetical protein